MKIIGRSKEQGVILDCLQSPRAEFLTLYGRRRVGKTFLIKEFFNNQFSFYTTGIANQKTKEQLRVFHSALQEYGDKTKAIPSNWLEAFSRLKQILESHTVIRDASSGKRVVFLDELPWMDTAKSDFKSALDYFWNSWGSTQSDLLLIVCGSATSWILDNLVSSKGGLYNRITKQIHLLPFNLKECEELLIYNDYHLSREQLLECYMILGGIPYYLNCLNRRLSLAQNIDELCFNDNGQLRHENDRLFQSLFKHSEKHIAIIKAIAKKKSGITRVELAKMNKIGDGEPLTKALKELEQCGFIRKYKNFVKNKQGFYYQLIDPFVLFHLNFIEDQKINSWSSYINSPSYYSWSGNSFEIACLNHINQIKTALGISGISSTEYSWKSKASKDGAQIDLLIDRKDNVINVCEMKHTLEAFTINDAYAKSLTHKLVLFREETHTKKTLCLTMISTNGIVINSYSGIIQNEINLNNLFA